MKIARPALLCLLLFSLGSEASQPPEARNLTVTFKQPRDCAEARRAVQGIDVVVTCHSSSSRYYTLRVTDKRRVRQIAGQVGALDEVERASQSHPVPMSK